MRRWLANRLLRAVVLLVPRDARAEWLEDWEAELAALEMAHRRTRDPRGPVSRSGAAPRSGPDQERMPGWLSFAFGAIPHAICLRKEGWSMDSLVQDLRYAVRVLVRSPGFSIVATLTLALGIGTNATVLSLVNGLVLRSPAGVVEPDRLVQIARSYEQDPRWDVWSWPAMEEIRRSSPVFEDVIGYSGEQFIIGSGESAETVVGEMVTVNYFDGLGLKAAVGRVIEPSDDGAPGTMPVVVLGYDLWRRRFGGDPGVIGTTLAVSGSPYTIVGVAPRGYRGIETLRAAPELFIPALMYPSYAGLLPFNRWGWSWISVVGRLADGVSIDRARAAMDVEATRLRSMDPVNEGVQVLLEAGVGLAPDEQAEASRISLLLTGIAALVLLLTCANVANLFIARATTRTGEMGVRIALGAGRGRIARQLGTESIVLAFIAATVAAPLVMLAAGLLPALLPYSVSASLAPDIRVFGGLVVLGALAGILFGAAPSVLIARGNLTQALREGGATGGTSRSRVRDWLVIGQLAVSLALLAAAALLGRSVLNASTADPGFDPHGLLVASLDLDLTGRYDRDAALGFYERAREAAAEIPGVESVTVATRAPFLGPFTRATRTPAEQQNDPDAGFEADAFFIDDAYFRTMGIPIVRGRAFTRHEPGPGIIVNHALAGLFWPGEDPIGRIVVGSDKPRRVIGVAADVRSRSLRSDPRPTFYEPLPVAYGLNAFVQMRTSVPPASLFRPFRARMAELDPGLPVTRVADVHVAMTASLGETRSIGILVAAFAVLAMVLSTVGLYGLVAFGVSRRKREMGIRIALGAEPRALVRMVMAHGLVLTVAGLVLGAGIAVLLGRALAGVLYDVNAASPLILALAAATLLGVTMVAAWLPARTASRVDAVRSLRS
jgi:putative ABC transport system permease protein